MNRLRRMLAMVLALALALTCLPTALAAEDTVLLTKNGKSITTDMTIEDVCKLFGQPKLETISFFGGSAYTFYGEDYADYLFLETNEKGQIASFSTFGDDFTSIVGNAGETAPTSWYGMRYGETYSDYSEENLIYGIVGYWWKHFDQGEIEERYKSDAKYSIAINQHAIPMWEAIAIYRTGESSTIEFDERTFYINRQLMEGGSSLYMYCDLLGRSEYELISESNCSYSSLGHRYMYPTPMMYTYNADSWWVDENSYVVFDFIYETLKECRGSLSKDFYAEVEKIPYTQEEQEKLEEARAIYAECLDKWNNAGTYYDREPQYETLPIDEGVINPQILEAALCYLNAIRAGAGVPLMELSEELCEGAQCKAALSMYLSANDIPNPSPHSPPQPEGVSDEFYEKTEAGTGENLYFGDVISSIYHAMFDGHRDPLLDPTYRYVGLGSVDGQGCHKFEGSQAYYGDAYAWPSIGVMLDIPYALSNMWYSIEFLRFYNTTEDTGVIFRCLNTGKTVSLPAGSDGLSVNSKSVWYKHEDIYMSIGNVYEITFTNMMNHRTGKVEDYTYRSVCEAAYPGDSDLCGDVTLDTEAVSIGLSERKKLHAQISEEAKNKMVHWSSSNEKVATVNENGYVTGVAPGTVTITATTDAGLTDTCEVTVLNHTHKYNEDHVVVPTCTEKGYTVYTCECGASYMGDYVSENGHGWMTHYAGVDSTCVTAGIPDYFICQDCNKCLDWYGNEITEWTLPLDPDNHSGKSKVTGKRAPTCIEEGYTGDTVCRDCGAVLSAGSAIPVTEHNWIMGEVIVAPTMEQPGQVEYRCKVCDEREVREVCAIGECDGGQNCVSGHFTDLDLVNGGWYHAPLDYMVSNGYISGTSDTTMSPNQSLVRAQLVAILYRMAGSPSVEGLEEPFTDVDPEADFWYYNAVVWAYNNKVVTGTSETTFEGGKIVAREQIATILYRYYGEPAVEGNLDIYVDAGKVNGYAVNAMIWATQNGLINGVGENMLNPLGNANRAQAATILYRYANLAE